MECNKCKKVSEEQCFKNNSKTFKTCFECREQSRNWRKQNKERVSEYNKLKLQQKKNEQETIFVIYGKKASDEEWIKYESLQDVVNKLEVHKPNVCKVLKGKLKTTGGYMFRKEEEKNEKEQLPNWKKIKEEKGYVSKPSHKRVLHETINEVIGKKCCSCKEWKPLSEYNKLKSHWDGLRNDCKDCLVLYRKSNRKTINENQKQYEKERREKDENFRLSKQYRTKLTTIFNKKDKNKYYPFIGCTIQFLIEHLESQFKEGMNWKNHGQWHIDHIVPCAQFDLCNEEELHKCFRYTNLQPLWAKENLSKSGN